MYAAQHMDTEPVITSIDPPCTLYWQGAGWYAPTHHASYEEGEWFTEDRVSCDPNTVPEMYGTGMGTPTWYDEIPTWPDTETAKRNS